MGTGKLGSVDRAQQGWRRLRYYRHPHGFQAAARIAHGSVSWPMSDLRGRALIENRFGKLGGGQSLVVIGDAEYDLPTLLTRLDLGFEDSWPIDVQVVSEKHFCIRYYDG